VRGDDDRRSGAVDPVQQLHDPDRGLGVEVAGRLVGQQQRRVVDERARDADALLLAARQLVGEAVELQRQSGQGQDVGHLGADLLAMRAGDLERIGDVVVDRAVGQQLEVLEDDAEVAAVVRHLFAVDLAQVASSDTDRPARRLEFLEEQPHDGRFARPGLPDEEHKFAPRHGERDVVQPDIARFVGLVDPAELDYGRGTVPRRSGALEPPAVAFCDGHRPRGLHIAATLTAFTGLLQGVLRGVCGVAVVIVTGWRRSL
jgi:hypothetical protein